MGDQEDGGHEEDGGDGFAGEGFCTTIAVRVLFVGGSISDGDAAPDYGGSEDVGGGFEAVGGKSGGAGDEPGPDFNESKGCGRNEADQREALTGLMVTVL